MRQPLGLSKNAKWRSNHVLIYLLATAFLSGTVCYRLGRFAGCTSSWLSSIQDTNYYDDVSSDTNGDDNTGGLPSYDINSRRPRKSSRQNIYETLDRRFIQRPSVPYACGVVFFYHIPCAGGTSINQWFKRYSKPENGNFSYYQHWAIETRKDGSFHPDPEKQEATFAKGMNAHIQNLGPNEWRIAHSHLVSTYLNESEPLLNKWRSDVEAQGCELINTVMLRDPLNHAMALHKIVHAKNSTRQNWSKHLSSPTGQGLWATILDFFLYNNHGNRYHDDYPNGPGGRNPYNVTKQQKVTRAMELLHRHFDVVTVSDHATFMGKILEWTGWKHAKMPHGNVYKKPLQFTKKEVEFLQKGLERNGDLDFVDRVKLEYHDYLSYLDS